MGVRRPQKMNALSRDMYRTLARAFHQLEHDPALRVGVIWAEGPHFTSGVDLMDWADVFASGTPFPVEPGEIDPFGLAGPRLSKPLVMAVQGRCYTWGWELLLNTDIRVAASDTRFAMVEVKRGFYACGGATLRLPAAIGWSNAQRYLLTGDELPADEAHRLGLVQQAMHPGRTTRSGARAGADAWPRPRHSVSRRACARHVSAWRKVRPPRSGRCSGDWPR